MMLSIRKAGFVLAFNALGVSAAIAQPALVDLLRRYDVEVGSRGIEGVFDDDIEPDFTPTYGLQPGTLALPLALLRSGTVIERINAAYTFGVFAKYWSGYLTMDAEIAAATSAMVEMMGSQDRRARIAGARVIGRVLACHFDLVPEPYPNGVLGALFTLLNSDSEIEQLAAMDALGLIRASTAVSSLTERYWYYRTGNKRALAGGALEALTRIGDPSTIPIARQLVTDRWASGKDATALTVAFARHKLLGDSSYTQLQQALEDKSRRAQAARYLRELVPSLR